SLCLLRAHTDRHSFPTRRSSDLDAAGGGVAGGAPDGASPWGLRRARRRRRANTCDSRSSASPACCSLASTSSLPHSSGFMRSARSEEHTSELQSRFDLVCRLLLE